MSADLLIATGMCCDTPGQESAYPQVDGLSSSARFQAVYWRCSVVFFASSVRHNPKARHALFTNSPEIPKIGRFATERFLEDLGVEVIRLPFGHAPPAGYYGRWRSTFYLFDILHYLAHNPYIAKRVLVHDTDCVFIKPADALARAIDRHGVLTYDCHLDPNEDINGISRVGLGGLYPQLGGPEIAAPPHFGAEIFAASAGEVATVCDEIEKLWQANMRRFSEGKPHFNTEEHYLSFVFNKLGYRAGTANEFINRIWTGFHYLTSCPSDFELTVWHVPAEKKYGLRRLYEQARRRESRFWKVAPGDEFARYAAEYVGIPRSSPYKRSRDLYDALKARLFAPTTS